MFIFNEPIVAPVQITSRVNRSYDHSKTFNSITTVLSEQKRFTFISSIRRLVVLILIRKGI